MNWTLCPMSPWTQSQDQLLFIVCLLCARYYAGSMMSAFQRVPHSKRLLSQHRYTLRFTLCACVRLHACTLVTFDSLQPHGLNSPPGFSGHGISQSRILEWLPFPTPEGLPNPGIQTTSLGFPTLASGFFTTEPPAKPKVHIRQPH